MFTWQQGMLGLTTAINYFTHRGFFVSIPLIDAQSYDLVVDDGNSLLKVQVKTTNRVTKAGKHRVKLDTSTSNGKGATRKNFDNTKTDYVFVYIPRTSEMYLIPSPDITVVTDMVISPDCKWKVE